MVPATPARAHPSSAVRAWCRWASGTLAGGTSGEWRSGSAPALGAGGRGFKSPLPDQLTRELAGGWPPDVRPVARWGTPRLRRPQQSPPGARPGQLVVSIMRRPAMPAVGNHMITEAFRGRRETCRALRRATLRDRNVSSSRTLEQRPGGGGVFGQSSMTAKRSSENAWTPSAAASAPAMARPTRLPRRRCRSRSGRPIVPPSSHAQWMACAAWRHSRGAEPGHLGGLDGGHEDGRLGWCRNVKNPAVAQPSNGIGANRATSHCLDC
jgi:hypothetical protein